MSAQEGQVSSRTSKDENGDASNVCRDYLRNVCKRGSHCRYWHPPADVAVGGGVAFCHDFQNAGCRRPGCRFVHCSREEEDQFRRTGQLPTACGTGEHHTEVASDIPVCKDFLKGECRRGIKCKYEHLPMPMENAGQSKSASAIGGYSDGDYPSAKIRRTEPADGEVELVTLADYRAVEEENQLLKRDVDELRRTVGVLVAANEMLLEQNAKYRVSASPMASQVIAAPAVIASSSPVAALSHIAIDGGGGLLVAQQPATAASVAVATLRPCVTATATLHPVMTATARLHPIATATLHSVGTATLHQNATTTLHPVTMDPSPVSMAIGMPSHTIVPMTLTVASIPPVASSLTSSSHLQSMSTYVTYPIMSNGTHSA